MIEMTGRAYITQKPDPQCYNLTPAAKARLAEIERGEPRMADLSDDELRRKTEELKVRLRTGKAAVGRS